MKTTREAAILGKISWPESIMQAETDYIFSNNWFDGNKAVWSELLKQLSPTRILEVGSYEGKSTAFIIESLASINDIEIHCIDSWEGGLEHKQGGAWEADMTEVEARFARNMKIAMSKSSREVRLELHKGLSNQELPRLVANGRQGYLTLFISMGLTRRQMSCLTRSWASSC